MPIIITYAWAKPWFSETDGVSGNTGQTKTWEASSTTSQTWQIGFRPESVTVTVASDNPPGARNVTLVFRDTGENVIGSTTAAVGTIVVPLNFAAYGLDLKKMVMTWDGIVSVNDVTFPPPTIPPFWAPRTNSYEIP
jgi:hypothetical protein